MQNNSSNLLFPTETLTEERTRTRRKSFNASKDDFKSHVSYSSMFSKPKLLVPQLQILVDKIKQFVEDIDKKIQNRVQLVKQVYVSQYKEQVLQMSTQLKNLRQKLDDEMMKEKANQKMFYLQEERDFFRHQVTKLAEQINKFTEENKRLKKLLDQEKRELANYKKIVYSLEEKVLKLKNQNIERTNFFNSSSKPSRNNEPSTIDTKHFSGAKTHRSSQREQKTLQTIQDQQEVSRSSRRLVNSQSMQAYPKMARLNREPINLAISYPRLTVQKLQKIEGYSELLQRQQIIDQCINELKRQIYYRNLSIGEKQSVKLHFNQNSQVRFEMFTKTDKKQLIVKLLSNPKVLDEFYQFLFNNTRTSIMETPSATQLINEKLEMHSSSQGFNSKWSMNKLKFSDPRTNTQNLNDLKTQFNKKIFDLKHNR